MQTASARGSLGFAGGRRLGIARLGRSGVCSASAGLTARGVPAAAQPPPVRQPAQQVLSGGLLPQRVRHGGGGVPAVQQVDGISRRTARALWRIVSTSICAPIGLGRDRLAAAELISKDIKNL